jgi:predicted Zn-dependent peptidase
MNVRLTRLDNGIRVVTSTLPHVESVAVGLWVAAGGRYEPPGMSGASHFIEHLLFKGTGKRSAAQISRAIEGRGGYLNAFTQEESTCYYARVGYDHAWHALDVLVDMFRDPKFDPSEMDRERGVIIEEIMMYRDQPQHLVQDVLSECLWQRHSLGRPLTGTPETLRAMDRSDLLAFKERYYVPTSVVFAFAGRIEHERCVSHVARLAGDLPSRPARRFPPVGPNVRQRGEDVRQRDIEQVHMAVGMRVFGRHDPRRYALRILSAILGENMMSRLFQVVREKHGLAYSIHSSCHLFRESGAFVVSAGLDKRRAGRAVELIAGELLDVRDRGVGPRELSRARDYILGQMRLSLESTTNHMMWVGDNLVSYGRFVPPEESVAALKRVTADDVRHVAADALRGRQCSLAMVTPALPESEEARIRAALARL